MVLRLLFLSFGNINVKFVEVKKLTGRSYDTAEALFTTSRVEIIKKKEFTKVALDKNSETFVVHIIVLEVPIAIPIHPFRALQVQDDPILAALQ